MGYSIATSGESLPIPNQTNKRHVCALPELCVKTCREVSLLHRLVSRYCPCYDQAVSGLNNIGSSMRMPQELVDHFYMNFHSNLMQVRACGGDNRFNA